MRVNALKTSNLALLAITSASVIRDNSRFLIFLSCSALGTVPTSIA